LHLVVPHPTCPYGRKIPYGDDHELPMRRGLPGLPSPDNAIQRNLFVIDGQIAAYCMFNQTTICTGNDPTGGSML
jgi:hypothetical protein